MEKIDSGISKIDGKRFMTDSQGRLVPIEMVKPVDQERDTLVRDVINRALVAEQYIADFKKSVMDDIKAFVDLSVEQYGVKLGGEKGNITIPSYDGKYRLIVAVGEIFTFDERLQAAKALVDELLREWSVGARPELVTIINDAFKVDKAGKINVKAIMNLRKYDIQDDRWKRAMEAISDSIQVAETKEYLRLHRRVEDSWVPFEIDVPVA